MLGSLQSAESIAKDLAAKTGMICVSVAYRLAPEYKFPVPVKVNLKSLSTNRISIPDKTTVEEPYHLQTILVHPLEFRMSSLCVSEA